MAIKYTWSFIGVNGKRRLVRGGFSTKKRAEADLKKIKKYEIKTFGKIQKITKSIRIIKKK